LTISRIYRITRAVRQRLHHAGVMLRAGTRPAGATLSPERARHQEQVMRDEAGRKVETSVEARAGFLDRPVLAVLCASLALGVVVLGALWLFAT
jgi:hypothetical protein